jgi:hypothetical protein
VPRHQTAILSRAIWLLNEGLDGVANSNDCFVLQTPKDKNHYDYFHPVEDNHSLANGDAELQLAIRVSNLAQAV